MSSVNNGKPKIYLPGIGEHHENQEYIIDPSLFATNEVDRIEENNGKHSTVMDNNTLPPSITTPGQVKVNPIFDWQHVPVLRQRNTKRPRLSFSSPEDKEDDVTTENRFQPLEINEDENAMDTIPEEGKKESRPPPIVLYGIQDVSKLCSTIGDVIEKTEFSIKIITKQQLRINVKTAEVYKKLIDFIREKNLIGHSFTRKEEKPFRIVIRNLHSSTPLDEISKVLTENGHKVRGPIINAKHGPNKTPTSTFFVNLEQSSNNKEAYNIKYIYFTRVSVEPPRKQTGLVQCMRCQQYGHTRNNCMRPWRCVKCAEAHKTADCPKKDRNTPATCALCLEDHPANYRGCAIYQEILKRKTKDNHQGPEKPKQPPLPARNLDNYPKMPNSSKENEHQQIPRSAPRNRTYAQTTTNQQETTHQTSRLEDLITKQSEGISMLIQQMSTLMGLLTTVINKLCK